MKTDHSTKRRIAGAVALFQALAVVQIAVSSEEPSAGPPGESRVTVEGTARIYGDWDCKGDAIVRAVPGEGLESVPGFPGGIQNVAVTVPVADIVCNDDIVSNRFREALKYKEYPEIHFNMHAYVLEEDGKAEVKGKFTIAGMTRDVDLEAKLTPLPQNALSIAGNLEILMTDYGIEPPEALFGLVKVRDNISVKFDLNIRLSGEIPNRAAVSGHSFPRTEKSSTRCNWEEGTSGEIMPGSK
jgi:hypothetical protein